MTPTFENMAKESNQTAGKKRNTFFIDPVDTRKIKYIALKEDTTQTDIVEKALKEYIAKYEKKNGEIKL